jgi:hypothetical protein
MICGLNDRPKFRCTGVKDIQWVGPEAGHVETEAGAESSGDLKFRLMDLISVPFGAV